MESQIVIEERLIGGIPFLIFSLGLDQLTERSLAWGVKDRYPRQQYVANDLRCLVGKRPSAVAIILN